MTTNENDRKAFQLWADTTPEVVDKAKEIADRKRMTFRGFIGVAIEKAVEAENDESGS